MKKCTILLIGVVIFNFCAAQQILPLDEDINKIIYSEVVTVTGFSAQKLYENAKKWFALNKEGNPLEITSEDPSENTIYGLGGFLVPSGKRRIECIYSIRIYIKDGRYKYELIDFVLYHNTDASASASGFAFFKSRTEKQAEEYKYSLETFYPIRLTDEKVPEAKYFEAINVETFHFIDREVKSTIGSLALEMRRDDDF